MNAITSIPITIPTSSTGDQLAGLLIVVAARYIPYPRVSSARIQVTKQRYSAVLHLLSASPRAGTREPIWRHFC
jgi:hypothetical protein